MSRDGRILQQRFERAQAEDLVQNLFDDAVLFHQAERRLLFLHQLGDGRADFRAHALAGHGGERFQVDPVQQLAVQRELQLLVFGSVAFAREESIYPAGFPVSPALIRILSWMPSLFVLLSEQCETFLAVGADFSSSRFASFMASLRDLFSQVGCSRSACGPSA